MAVGAAPSLRLLLWLRWKLTVRGFSRSKARWVGLVLLVLLALPWSLGIAAATFFALWKLPVGAGAVTGEMVLRSGLTLTALIWVLAPLLGFSLSDAYDITRLFTYPLTRQRLFLGALLGSLLDGSTLFLLPAFVAAVVALTLRDPAAAAVAALALPLFLLQTLALSQAIVLATQGILKSRKFRDIALVVLPFFWVAYQIGNQYFWRSFTGDRWQTILTSGFWKPVTFFPSGLTAHAIGAAARREWAPAAGWLILLAAAVAVTLRAAAWLVAQAYADTSAPQVPEAQRERRAAHRAPWLERLPPACAAVLVKERLLLRREPYFRLLLVNLLSSIAIAAFLTLSRTRGALGTAVTDWVLLGATALILLQQSAPLYNQFGHDGFAAPLLFGFPARRREIVLGKNLALLSVALPMNAVLSVALCILTRRPDALLFLAPFTLLASLVQVAVGNLLSLAFPFRAALRNFRGRQNASGMGAGQSLLYLLVFVASNLFQLPVAAAVLAPRLWIESVWLALTLPLALGYAAGLYALSLHLFEPLIAERELFLVERLTQPES